MELIAIVAWHTVLTWSGVLLGLIAIVVASADAHARGADAIHPAPQRALEEVP